MTITGVSNSHNYALANLPNRVDTGSSTPAKAHPISLSTDSIDFAISNDAPSTDASNHLLLFFALNSEVLASKNLAGVGATIDAYTNSLTSSNVYDSPYTAPSAKFLADLNDLKTAAAAGNQTAAEAALAAGKADAPDNIIGGQATAAATGDIRGLAGLQAEATANISDFLRTQGYSSSDAFAQAVAVIINGDTLNAVYTSSYTPDTRLRQTTGLAVYAANSTRLSTPDVASTVANPLINIYEALLEAKSGPAIGQSLTNLTRQYTGSTSSTSNTHA